MFSLKVYAFKRWEIYISFIFLLVALAWLSNNYIFNDAFYYSVLGNQFREEQVVKFIELKNKFQWLNYTAIPIIYLLKWLILAGIIYVGQFLFNQNVAYKSCFKIVQLAELVIIFAATAKLIFFIFHKPQTLEEVQYFYPLAITQLFDSIQIPKYLIYPLQQLNIFEVLYWLFIAAGIQSFTQKPFVYSLKIVASSYGVALGIWVLAIMFIQLQFSA